MNQSQLQGNTCSRRQARENARGCGKSRLVLVLLLIGLESGANFSNQSQSEVNTKSKQTRITFDIHLKTAV